MSRTRNVKPSFFTNDDLSECSAFARLLFIGLWTIADRAGRLEDRPKKIRAEILPYDECDIVSLIGELEAHRFIHRYEINGSKYIQILNFTKHQKVHPNEQESVIPASDGSITKVIPKDDQGDDLQAFSFPSLSNSNLNPPLPPHPEKNGVFKNGNGKGGFHVANFLDDNAIMEARLQAPRWDIHNLMNVYDEGISSGMRDPPKNPKKAFPAWCKSYTKGLPP